MISVVAQEVKDVYKLIEKNDSFFFNPTLDEVVTSHEAVRVLLAAPLRTEITSLPVARHQPP